MNYRDVAVLNDSLDSLSQNLLKQKMLQEQAREREAQTGLASQRLATDQAFREAQQQHYNTMESKQSDANAIAQQRADAQEDHSLLQTYITANAAGMFDQDGLDQVNQSLRDHPRLGLTGIQLTIPKKISPQAGQNAQAQLAQQISYWSDQIDEAPSDQKRAVAQSNFDFLTKVRDRAMQEPAAKRTIKVKTGGVRGGVDSGQPEVTQEMTPEEFQDYQAQQSRGKPLDAQTATQILKQAGGDKAKARALAIQQGYSLAPAQ